MSRTETPTPGRAARIVVDARFRVLWFGETVSLLGTATSAVLVPLLAVTVLQVSAAAMGLLTAAIWLPWLVVGLPAGAWVDRMSPRRVMITADLVAAAALGSIPVAVWLGVLTWWQLLIVALATGTATVFFRPAYAKLVPSIVADEALEQANARLVGSESVSQIVGPGLGGLLARLLGVASGIAVDAVSFVVSAICLWRIDEHRGDTNPAAPAASPPRRDSLKNRIAEGIRFVVADPALRSFTIIGGLSNFGLTGYQTLLVLFYVRIIGLTESGVGIALMIGAIGGLMGSFVARPMSRLLGNGRASTVLLLVGGPVALLIPAVGSVAWIWVSVLGLVGVGLTVVAGNVIRGAWQQGYVPEAIMARATTARQVINYGTMPIAGLCAGILGEHLGVQPTMLIMIGVHAVACWSILLTQVGRRRALPAKANLTT